MAFKITTTNVGSPPSIVGYPTGSVQFIDLGSRVYAHPTTAYDLETEFSPDEIARSGSVQDALDNGWITAADANGNNITISISPIIAGDVSGSLDASTVDKIKNVEVDATIPTDGQLLAYDSGLSKWIATTVDAITALIGEVSASGPGSASATVNSVGGSSAANINSAELAANAATDSNTASKIVKRDASGNFSAGTITASLTGHASLDLALAGGTMSGDIAMGGNKITGLADGTANNDAVNFGQLQSVANGQIWQDPILDPNLIDDTLNSPPGSPLTEATYIIGPTPSGGWSGFVAGSLVTYNGSVWIDILGRAVMAGDRLGVTFELGTAAGGLSGKGDYIAEIVSPTPGSITYTFTAPIMFDTVSVTNTLSISFAHSYNYNGAMWVEISGPNAILAGDALDYNGNTLNVLFDGVTLELDGFNQLIVKTGGISNTQVNAAAAIAYSKLNLATAIVNADIAVAAAIAYSKLNLSNSIVNADVNASAAIAYSKINLSNSIVNADINASAAIAYSKLSLSGNIVNADIAVAAAIAYSKLNLSNSIVNADINASAAIDYSKLNLVSAIVNADIAVAAAIARSKIATGSANHVVINDGTGLFSSEALLAVSRGGTNSGAALNNNRIMQSSGSAVVEAAAITAARALISDANGIPTHSSVTSATLDFLDATSSVQTQINSKMSNALTSAHIFVGNGGGVATDVALSGDASLLNTGALTVTKIQSRAVATTAPSNGQALAWNSGSSQWEPQTVGGGSGVTSVVTSNTTTTLNSSSNNYQIFTGTTPGQIIKLPDATTLSVGTDYFLVNKSTVIIPVQNNSGTVIAILYPEQYVEALVTDISSVAGIWFIESAVPNAPHQILITDEFMNAGTASGSIGMLGWTLTSSGGAGSAAYQTSTAGMLGVLRASTSTSNNAAISMNLGTTTQIVLGGGILVYEQHVAVPSLGGTGTAQFTLRVGLQDTTGTGDNANGVYFEYAGTAGGTINWSCKTASASTRTTTSSGVAVAAATFYKLSFVVNAAGTSVDFYINNNFVATITTNIPTTGMAPALRIIAGATSIAAKSADIDYMMLMETLTTLR